MDRVSVDKPKTMPGWIKILEEIIRSAAYRSGVCFACNTNQRQSTDHFGIMNGINSPDWLGKEADALTISDTLTISIDVQSKNQRPLTAEPVPTLILDLKEGMSQGQMSQ